MLPIEKQVCSLEYSKKLKELGVKQESLFYWIDEGKNISPWIVSEPGKFLYKSEDSEWYSAFTVADLGVMLPDFIEDNSKIEGNHYALQIAKVSKNIKTFDKGFDDENEANLRAKSLIYAIQKEYITVSEINERI